MSSIVFDEPLVPAALDAFEVFRSIKLTSSERKAIQAAREKLNTAGTIAWGYIDSASSSNRGEEWPFQRKIWDACGEFLADPTEATAERVALVVAMGESAKTTFAELKNALTQMHVQLAAELQPVASRVLDAAVEVINPQIKTARAALESAPGLAAELQSFDQRVVRLHQIIADERAVAAADALNWIGINCQV